MEVADVRGLIINEVSGDELPHRVVIVGQRYSVPAAGTTLAGALMRAFCVAGMFPDERFMNRTYAELARFIGYRFPKLTENMKRAIDALTAAARQDGEEGG